MKATSDDSALVEEIVRRVLERMGGSPATAPSERLRDETVTALQPSRNPAALERIVAATPARLGVGRCGTRYLTPVYLRLRADHAIAKDAVYSELPEGFANAMQCVALRTCAADRETFLLRPDEGRRLHPEARALLVSEGTPGADVQIILGDGLSAWALERNAPELVPAMEREITARGMTVGRRLVVHRSRIAVADEIGVVLGAKSTVILVGERPGLGTGDSLSAYIAYGPRIDQDNAEKNCVSNIRPLGMSAQAAARQVANILARAFATGHGGVAASVSRGAGEGRRSP